MFPNPVWFNFIILHCHRFLVLNVLNITQQASILSTRFSFTYILCIKCLLLYFEIVHDVNVMYIEGISVTKCRQRRKATLM